MSRRVKQLKDTSEPLLQTWEQAKAERNMVFPRPEVKYAIDLSAPIEIDNIQGRNLAKLTDARFLSLWRNQKNIIAGLVTEADMAAGYIQVVFKPDAEANNRLVPERA